MDMTALLQKVKTMRIMLIGDTHGDFDSIKRKIGFARKYAKDVTRFVVLGDFGLWWGFDGLNYIEDIQNYATKHRVQVFALPGNHENYEWWNAAVDYAPAYSHGWAYLRTNVLLSPRVHEFKWAGKQFVVAGGAVSIDKDYRIDYERRTGQRIWSPDEQLTDEEVDDLAYIIDDGQTDYLLTHDCSDYTPFYDRMKPDLDSQLHRKRIDKVIGLINPKMHFHGHMHNKYEWVNTLGTGAFGSEPTVEVQTYGLECNSDDYSWGILDLDKDTYTWGPDIIKQRFTS